MNRNKRLHVVALVSALVVWAAAVSSVDAVLRTAPGPTVISGFKDGPVEIPLLNQADVVPVIAQLSLPPGRWIAWAKLYVGSPAGGGGMVDCDLGTPARGGWFGHEVSVRLGWKATRQTLALSAAIRIGSTGGKLSLGCAAPFFGGSAGNWVAWIKIMAMKVGTLTQVNLDTGTTTTVGSGSPIVVIGSRDLAVSLDSEPTTVAQLHLPAGAWWIRTEFEHTFSLGASDKLYSICTVLSNRTISDSDRINQVTDTQVGIMDGVTVRSYGQTVVTRCARKTYSTTAIGTEWVRHTRITAVKLGTLTTFDKYGYSHLYGSGVPVAYFKTSLHVLATTNATYPIGTLDLGPGNWMMFAKADVQGAPVSCNLLTSFDYDRSVVSAEGDVALAVVHHAQATETDQFTCQPSLSSAYTAVSFDGIHISAFKLGSLTNVAL